MDRKIPSWMAYVVIGLVVLLLLIAVAWAASSWREAADAAGVIAL